jgi:hypothetical protein
MNVSTTSFSPAQMILAWTLILLLLSWFSIFTALAIHDYLKRKVEWEDIPSSSRPIPIIDVLPQEEHNNVVEMPRSPSPHHLMYTKQPGERGSSRLR